MVALAFCFCLSTSQNRSPEVAAGIFSAPLCHYFIPIPSFMLFCPHVAEPEGRLLLQLSRPNRNHRQCLSKLAELVNESGTPGQQGVKTLPNSETQQESGVSSETLAMQSRDGTHLIVSPGAGAGISIMCVGPANRHGPPRFCSERPPSSA